LPLYYIRPDERCKKINKNFFAVINPLLYSGIRGGKPPRALSLSTSNPTDNNSKTSEKEEQDQIFHFLPPTERYH
jgi:hypothetical protein